MQHFFSPEEEAQIIEAIRVAETGTTGEIRVHLEFHGEQDAMAESIQVFKKLGMDKTRDRNGVLILLEINKRTFAIIGDEGITSKVSENFWAEERDLLQTYFRRHDFTGGLVLAIQQVGAKLKRFFPYSGGDNPNELPNEISYGQ